MDNLKKKIKRLDDKISQYVVNEENLKTIYAIGKSKLYRINENEIDIRKRDLISNAKFIKGVPNGAFEITFSNGEKWSAKDITQGRVFDFVQELKPQEINLAGYDNTIRGEFPQLLDLDHAEEIDRLRRYMQDGNLSHYEYDDCNPVYPKAGK
ncbi:histidine decarboxylase maturation protein HdcB [Ligilactobacillus aviarius]|uniref:histidine decarboxylase maturation protein HdcB n=1 Tax=Ligilactobacillus aviarius TaxID=1606 RepID=UPI0024BA2FBF|nr:histidine decarboxylase maturation protein HdcB [Ligilactobacillus aviarius]